MNHVHYELVKKTYFDLVSKYCHTKSIRVEKWKKLEYHYKRNDPTAMQKVSFIVSILKIFALLKDKIRHWDSFLFALYYFDVMSSVKQNEEYAKNCMYCLGVPLEKIEHTLQLIRGIENPKQEMGRPIAYAVSLFLTKRYENQQQLKKQS